MIREEDFKYLIGKYIIKYNITEEYIDFITDDNYVIRINKFEPYCCCYVGEYIDDIISEGVCFGTITNIDTNINNEYNEYDEYVVYKGVVSFYFENGKIDFNVHGEDNGYYGVSFTMPVEVFKGDE